jgi:hypothetical protein
VNDNPGRNRLQEAKTGSDFASEKGQVNGSRQDARVLLEAQIHHQVRLRRVGAQVAPDLAQELDALASVLRAAAEQNVEFSLVLRLHARDSMQGVCAREVRQGSFW